MAPILGTDTTLLIGTGNVPFEGLLDDLRLYHRILTDEQIRRIVAEPGQDSPSGQEQLVGWWKFDATTMQVLTDSSGNENHAHPATSGDEQWLIYKPDPRILRCGDNHLVITAADKDSRRIGANATAPILVKDLELHVDYR